MPIAGRRRVRRTLLFSGQEVPMTANKTETNRDPPTELIDPEQAVPQAPQHQAGLSESQMQLNQPGSSTKRTAPGRTPLFGR